MDNIYIQMSACYSDKVETDRSSENVTKVNVRMLRCMLNQKLPLVFYAFDFCEGYNTKFWGLNNIAVTERECI